MTTGKIIKTFKIKQEILKKTSTIFKGGDGEDKTYTNGQFYPRTLVYDTEPVDYDDKEYFGDRLKCDLDNSTAY